MMTEAGHEIIHYGNEGSNAPCSEFVQIFSLQDRERFFSPYEWFKKGEVYNFSWDGTLPYWRKFNRRIIEELEDRLQPKDLIVTLSGLNAKPIADAFPNHMLVEHGIGYEGVFSKYKVFESYAWMHHVYGLNQWKDGQFFDTVIPAFFDPQEFKFSEKKENYFLFLSRMTQRKGYEIAIEATKHLNTKLLIAGIGGDRPKADHVEYIGYADVEKKAELLSKARGLFVPTIYIEPFGKVHAEALISGCPVISTDWGAFPENIENGVNGFTCRTLQEFVDAGKAVDSLDYKKIREDAIKRYSFETAAKKYEAYFDKLHTLWGDGWYELTKTK